MGGFSTELNDDQLQVLGWVHDFAENVERPAGREWDAREQTPWPIIEEAARTGLYSLDFVANCFADPTGLLLPLVNEEMAWGDAGLALAILGSTLAVAGIVAAGTPEQVAEWAPRCFGQDGDVRLAALCVSEADGGGPDANSHGTGAIYDRSSETWTLNGTETGVINGGIADVHVVVASVEPGAGGRCQASFLVPPKTPGFSMGRKLNKAGIRACHTAEVILHDVALPGDCLLGGTGRLDERISRARQAARGRSPVMVTSEATLPAVAAQAVGIARAAYEHVTAEARRRVASARPDDAHEVVALKLADMRTRIDAARLLYMRAASMAMSGRAFAAGEGAMAKFFSAETAVFVTEQAVQIFQACGCGCDCPLERWHRDAKAHALLAGTSEPQRLLMARAITGLGL
ncbi:MAG: acyl-CoA dehydrogenase family protein [Acidimicrobiales bacterium]|jgi:alkylation response protein AidB-like acyl-CoA dehydrogenase